MSESSLKRSEEFLRISDQFKLGALVTELSHSATAHLSEAAKLDPAAALRLLFEVDGDVVRKYREFARSGRAADLRDTVLRALKSGGRIFFTGCGATGRLSIQLVSIWRDFWQRERARGPGSGAAGGDWEERVFSVMAGGDYALIKSVEGFEDFTEFGGKQLGELGVSARDVVFAITEGGETSFVIGTAWKGVEAGAKVYFVYNNPDDILCRHVARSREVIAEPRIEKINLTTGPMAITGSTRMQATTIQLCVLLTVLEMVLRDLIQEAARAGPGAPGAPWGRGNSDAVPAEFLAGLETLQATLESSGFLSQLAQLVALEECIYRSGRRTNYYADRFAIDVLTDTTERSPTYCTPPFRKFDDATAAESWAFLFVPELETPAAWTRILKRPPHCLEWSEEDIRSLVGPDQVGRTQDLLRKVNLGELMRFKVGLDGVSRRRAGRGDGAVAIVAEADKELLLAAGGLYRVQLDAARRAGAKTGVIFLGSPQSAGEIGGFMAKVDPACVRVLLPVTKTGLWLDGVTRVGVKVLFNALSTCTMVRLGRVMGNTMIRVVPSNLKLVDRATRYVQQLTGLTYAQANRLLFEVIEYVEPRLKADQACPPVVGMAVLRARHGISNEAAEKQLAEQIP